jgi:TM2 domain-containing membrane protein YozV
MRRFESRSATGALLLSWIIPGAGQFYLGERNKGA